ncbi:broad specificity phosphatase PhoE [Hamadaea flava]|uniref:Histidine phosphatase family protein n=1 Tax=Hamadaea flava TaxID=1742688 RepID=A0ABV8LNZ2_9ACTN|nr:histidine phosphatase family protein [Hamadaea flava]MCP2322655.1 broad specificity phosphatase PhoE [Hamadaea flava]
MGEPPTPILGPARTRLILVRHAMPAYGPDQPAEEWPLDPAGQTAAIALRRRLPPGALLVASAEPKARQTLEPSGGVTVDPRFGEVRRDEPYDGDFRARRLAYVKGVAHPGWESPADVVTRFGDAVADWRARAGSRPLVVASHGMALTLWLTAAIGLADPGGFWSALQLPDAFSVDLTTRQADRLPPAP